MTIISGMNSRKYSYRAYLIAAGLAVAFVLTSGTGWAFERPGSAWKIGFVDIDIAPGAPLRLFNPRGDNDVDLDIRVAGVVRTGLQKAISGYFRGTRPTRMQVTVNRFEGISTGATLLVGGEMTGDLDIEIIDPTTGEILAARRGLNFSRVIASGLLGFGAMIAGGGSQERKYADEIYQVSRVWLGSLLCSDEDCATAQGVPPGQVALVGEPLLLATEAGNVEPPMPQPRPQPVGVAVVTAELEESVVAKPQPALEEDLETVAEAPALSGTTGDAAIELERAVEPEKEALAEIRVEEDAALADSSNSGENETEETGFAALFSWLSEEEPAVQDTPESALPPTTPPPVLSSSDSEDGEGVVTADESLASESGRATGEVIALAEPAKAPEPVTPVATLQGTDPTPSLSGTGEAAEPGADVKAPTLTTRSTSASPEPEVVIEPELAEVTPADAPSELLWITSSEDPVAVTGSGASEIQNAGIDELAPVAGPDVLPVPRPGEDPEPDPNLIAAAPTELGPSTGTEAAIDAGTAPAAPDVSNTAAVLLVPAPAPERSTVYTQPLEAAPKPETVQAPTPDPELTTLPGNGDLVEAPSRQPLVNPAEPVRKPAPLVSALETEADTQAPSPTIIAPSATIPTPAENASNPDDQGTAATVETEIAAANPDIGGPTLANAQWIGFTPAVFGNGSSKPGLWIAGPFDRRERTGWVTDTATGATTKVTFVWRDAAPGSQALLSAEASRALGLAPGDVANIAVYLPR